MHFATIAVDGSSAAVVRLSDGSLLEICKAASSLQGDLASSLQKGTLQAIIEGGPATVDAVRKLVADAESGDHAEARHSIKDVEFLAPIPTPRKNVFCVGRNYADHIAEGDKAQKQKVGVSEFPVYFTKPSTAVIGPRRCDSDFPQSVRMH